MASHAHQHDHTHPHAHPTRIVTGGRHDHTREASQRTLLIVLALTFGYMLAEAISGYLANSLALLSDAGHMLTDVAALTLSLFAVRFASRPATPRKTYGFYRLEILAALANGVTLIVLSLLIQRRGVSPAAAPRGRAGVDSDRISTWVGWWLT